MEVSTLGDWLREKLPTVPAEPGTTLDTATWLTIPQQHLLQLTAGEVFHDDLGELSELRDRLTWYPADVWRWLIAAQWELPSTAVPTLGRTVQTGDELGARVLVARCCRLVMGMAFLQARRYQPYPKWFGRAFTELGSADGLAPLLDDALTAGGPESLDALLDALRLFAEGHNALGITAPVTPSVTPFDVGINDAVRPYRTLNIGEFIDATVAAIEDPALRDLPSVGSIDQLTHAEDQLINFTDWPLMLREDIRRQLDPATLR